MVFGIALALLNPKLDAILDSPDLSGALVSCIVTDLEGKELYSRNATTRVMPASNQKLISCAYALHQLGKDYVPKTRIWKEKNRVVIDSPGDPSLTYKQLVDARKALKLNGKLPVYVKQAYRVGIPDSWEIDDLANRYAAPVSAFCFDQAAFELWAERGKAFLLPESFGVKISFDPWLDAGASRYDPIRKTIRVGRSLPAKRTRLDTLALPSADESAASIFGSRFYTTTVLPSRPADLTLSGQPLKEILKTCLVRSDNIQAENLLLMGAAKDGDISARPYTLARERVSKFLTDTVGMDKQDIRIYDGSGLSRHNLVTARGIAKLLEWANRQPDAETWRACLVSPLNGTLRGRLKDVGFQGKTGTLDMVVSLSGYVKTASGEERIMSLLLNHFVSSSVKARDILDNFAKTLSETGDGLGVALSYGYEARRHRSLSGHLSLARNWFYRPGGDGGFTRQGSDRRAEPAHEAVHRAERMALRGG